MKLSLQGSNTRLKWPLVNYNYKRISKRNKKVKNDFNKMQG